MARLTSSRRLVPAVCGHAVVNVPRMIGWDEAWALPGCHLRLELPAKGLLTPGNPRYGRRDVPETQSSVA
jgi:hypothetical protein